MIPMNQSLKAGLVIRKMVEADARRLKQNGLDEVIAEKRRQFESWKKQQE